MPESPPKPFNWSVKYLPGGGFSARSRHFFQYPFVAMTAASAWSLRGASLAGKWQEAGIALAGLVTCGVLAYVLAVPKKRLSVNGTVLVATNVSIPTWNREELPLDAKDFDALGIYSRLAETQGEAPTPLWELHAERAGQASRPILWGLDSREEAEWLKALADGALDRGQDARR